VNQRYQLPDAEKRAVKDRLRARLTGWPGVRFAYLHGSFLEADRFGDVDVAISVDPERLSGADPMTYELDLEAALEREVGLPIDVRVVEQAPASFRYAVTRGEELFVRDREALSMFRERTWNEYLDFAPLREEALRDLARHVRGG
jgi:predicted nucleotidyltransferase